MKFPSMKCLALAGVVMSSPLYAAEQTFPVDSFNQLVLSKGINAEVVCNSTPQVVASGKQYLLDKLQLGVSANELSLVNDGYRDEGIWPDKLTVKIYTDQPLKAVEAQFGVAVVADDCALTDEKLAVKGSMGASYELKGNVNTLDLDVSMGASFNEDVNNFYAQKANVTVAMGAQANLCHVNTVNGSASMGAKVTLGKQTQNNLSVSMGGYSTRSDCQ
ncbi:GIN domain-containing protein [Vibrio sp. MEBiC08052]|uniref:GIN domain-containing protein n=1 Tax=Vibrio sp. MEBiC08052 TaxID=1761910 RepID=UPI00074087D6|nr:DUF2807 domain-containing protein [Vibrio sp. MEBiC08052]KUI98744.1 hypothetical protein VRK_20740 [Vibrio sp. MEBiC08052]